MRYIRVAKRASHDHPPRLSPTAMFAILVGTLTLRADSGANLSFLRLPSISVGNVCCSVLTADFNGDGKTDIAAAYGTAAISIFLGDGKGNFTRSDMPLNLGAGIVLRGLTASADFNGDNIADLVGITDDTFADHGGGSDLGGVVLLGIGNGSFRAPIFLGPNVVKAVADFNRDGKLDLLVHPCAGDNGCGFAVRLGNGDGTFQPAGPITMQPAGDVTWWAVVADFNGDGKPDVVETTLQPSESVVGSVYLWLGNGDGSFGNVITTPLSGPVTLSQLATADFNGDGHPDLTVLVNSSRTASDFRAVHSVEILLGDGTGNFSLGSTYRVPYPAPLITADFEHAGRIDLAAGLQS